MTLDFSDAASGLLSMALEATGQRATVGTVSWGDPPAGKTEPVPTVEGRQEALAVAITRPTPSREQTDLGTRTEGRYVAVAESCADLREGTLIKQTRGPYAGSYFRVEGLPAKPSGHHWEARVEKLAADERAVQEDVLS